MTKSKQYLAWQLARNALAEHLKEHPTIVTNPATGESVDGTNALDLIDMQTVRLEKEAEDWCSR